MVLLAEKFRKNLKESAAREARKEKDAEWRRWYEQPEAERGPPPAPPE